MIVIGAGPAGETVAGRCADGGLSMALVEQRLVGGECLYYGCIPSKALIRPGDVLAATCRVPGAAEALTGVLDSRAPSRAVISCSAGGTTLRSCPISRTRASHSYAGRVGSPATA